MTFSNDHNFLMKTARTTILASLDSPRSPDEFGAKKFAIRSKVAELPNLPNFLFDNESLCWSVLNDKMNETLVIF
jgi:hypothetical protein